MMRLSLLLLIACFVSFKTSAQNDTLRVLFLGNSYTAYNNLPQLTANLTAGSSGKVLITDSRTPGGQTLEGHWGNAASLNKIKQGNWDVVVLQEQSQIPVIPFFKQYSMEPYAGLLNDTIRKYNGNCVRVMLYLTWGRQDGGQQCDPSGTNCSVAFADFFHMQDSLRAAYNSVADKYGLQVAPVGISWQQVLADTLLVLHTSDKSHPNLRGSFLAACTFYAAIWQESPTLSNFNSSLGSNLANYLKKAADSAYFYHTDNWNKDIYRPAADFFFSINADTVRFQASADSLNNEDYLLVFRRWRLFYAQRASTCFCKCSNL